MSIPNQAIVVFDRYETPSIKDYEHKSRENYSQPIKIPNRATERGNFIQDFKNIDFKNALVEFFIHDWAKDDRSSIIRNKTLFLSYDKCYKYTASGEKVSRSIIPSLLSRQIGADTRVVLHATNVYETISGTQIPKPVKILIKAADADILIIMLGNMYKQLNPNNEIWMEAGGGRRAKRFINISEMHQTLNSTHDVCRALPGFYAFTGNDFNPSFYRIAKKNPFGILEKDPEILQAFTDVSGIVIETQNYDEFIKSALFKHFEKYVCRLYTFQWLDDVDEARYRIFDKTYNLKNNLEILKVDVKNVDLCNFPPCKSQLYKHILRTGYITHYWQTAHTCEVLDVDPTHYGWIKKLDNGIESLDFDWFHGKQFPDLVDIEITEVFEKINRT